ncbi:hypothetical protein XOC_2337 [Xanthomonas oryzae pv. oryzicola BLS256]|uniref:Uncharacterized protein n=1 Tax=Xanthomonas oryzae pv. oryzicola (strain BLS256) TaxID=383407 RepID=G7TEV7_XANOB|nr:hypothetical protein XOC_2337 [Xanthomonas oryzae pv. oryzicola BLS256]QEO97533.1 hypothetical protein XOCgx_2543 [Xanthomonas oryzae pv. oryzicola]
MTQPSVAPHQPQRFKADRRRQRIALPQDAYAGRSRALDPLATAYGPSVRRRATSAVYRTGQTVAFAPRNARWNIKEIRVGSR